MLDANKLELMHSHILIHIAAGFVPRLKSADNTSANLILDFDIELWKFRRRYGY